MQKITTISMLTAILSLPAFAEIANNATCNNTNLGQSDNNSTANVEANWNANTININWYNGDTKITSNTCTYDGTITLPAQPSKPGYTFAGWRLRNYVNCTDISYSQCNDTPGCTTSSQCSSPTGCCYKVEDCSVYTTENDCLYKVEVSTGKHLSCRWYNDECAAIDTSSLN